MVWFLETTVTLCYRTQPKEGRDMAWPKTNDPRTEFVTVRFTATEHADLLWLMGHVNAKDRSAAVRQCVDRVIAAEKRRARKQKKSEHPVSDRALADAPEE